MAGLYTGTAEGCQSQGCAVTSIATGAGAYNHNVSSGKDGLGNEDTTTHAYWAKDTPDKEGFTLARNLAIQHTVGEIEKLWSASADNPGLRVVFGMTKQEKVGNLAIYQSTKVCDNCPNWLDSDASIDYVAEYISDNNLR